jgi:alpha/beta superfamily hydrolase
MGGGTMTSEVLPVTFQNKAGHRLFGMIHRPVKPCVSGAAIILLSPGMKMRVAPHRLYVNMAERFVALGYPVLRFDFYGAGDSEGEVEEEYIADLYGAIQVGRHIDDTIAAMDWMQRTYGIGKFIVSGLCGGAITGLLTADRDQRISCLLGLGIPVILDGTHIDSRKYMTDAHLRGERDSYVRKLWDLEAWQSWVRFLTFQSDYRLIFRSLLKPLLVKFRGTNSTPPSACQSEERDNTNPLFAPAFFNMMSSARHVYLIFSGSDRLLWEYETKFVERNRAKLESCRSRYEIHVTKDANHLFSFREWEEDMLDQCTQWLHRLEVGQMGTVARNQVESCNENRCMTA